MLTIYNEERKNRFINGITDSEDFARTLRSIFKKTEFYETLYKLDLCNLDKEILSKAVSSVQTVSARTAKIYANIIDQYLDWCVENGYSSEATEVVRDFTALNTVLTRSPEHLRISLDKFLPILKDRDAQTYGTFNCLYRTYCWVAFMGIPREDAEVLRCSNVDLEDKMIGYRGRGFRIYDESLFDIEKCLTSREFFQKRVEEKTKKTYGTLIPRAKNTYFLRGRKDGKPSSEIVLNVLQRIPYEENKDFFETEEDFKKAKKRFIYSNLYNSGVYYRAYITELKGGKADFGELCDFWAARSCSKKDESKYKQNKANYYYKFKHGYEDWKKAFGLDS